jgi:hypothetical protein
MRRNKALVAGVFTLAALFGVANAAPLAPGASLTNSDSTAVVPAKAKGKKSPGKGAGKGGGKGHGHRHRHTGRNIGIGIGIGILGTMLCAQSGDC